MMPFEMKAFSTNIGQIWTLSKPCLVDLNYSLVNNRKIGTATCIAFFCKWATLLQLSLLVETGYYRSLGDTTTWPLVPGRVALRMVLQYHACLLKYM